MATTSVLALAIATADHARAGCTTNLGSSCANSATVTYLYVSGTTASVTNSGTISPGGAAYGIGVYVRKGATLGSITNSGYIQGNSQSGIQVYGVSGAGTTLGSITNTGTIVASGPNGQGIYVIGHVTVTGGITNTGLISAPNGPGIWVTDGARGALSFSGGIVNSGTISGYSGTHVSSNAASAGINVNGSSTSFSGGITNTGAIKGFKYGIWINSPASFSGAITNSGTVSGPVGISMQGVSGTVANTGTVAGTTGAGVQFGTTASTLSNSGTIDGGAGVAVQFGATAGNTLILGGGASFGGTVQGATGANTLILSGVAFTNALANQLAGFNYGNSPIVQGTGTSIAGSFGFSTLTVQGQLIVGSGSGATSTPGTLTITGNYVQSSNGTLTILATQSGTSKLEIGGAATLAGSLSVSASGTFVNGAKIPILMASGITGAFSQSSITVSPRLRFAVGYTGTEVDLTADQVTLQSLAATGNQAAVGAVLDRLSLSPPSALVPVINALNNLSGAQVPEALDAVGGAAQHYSGFATAGIIGAQIITSTIGQQLFQGHGAAFGGSALGEGAGAQRVQLATLDPLAALAQGPSVAPDARASPWSAWVNGYGIFGDVGASSAGHGLDYSTGGTAFGADYRLDPSLLAGAFAGYAGTGTSAPGLAGSGTIDAYAFGVYASWTWDRLYVDGMLGYAYDADHLTRSIVFPGFNGGIARASTSGNQFLSSLETGRSYALPDGFVATPFVGLQAITLDQASFTESGAGALDLAVGGQSTASVRTQLGSRFSRDVEVDETHVVNLGLKVGWAHELADAGTSTTASFAGAPGSAFSVQGAQRGRDSALVGVGAAAKLDRMSSVYLRYDGDLDGSDNAHAVIGGIRLIW